MIGLSLNLGASGGNISLSRNRKWKKLIEGRKEVMPQMKYDGGEEASRVTTDPRVPRAW